MSLDGGLLLALARGLSVAALLSAFGALLFRVALAPPVLARLDPLARAAALRRWRALVRASWCAAVLGTLAWLLLQAGSFADASGASAAGAVPSVLTQTRFGHLVLLKLALLGLVAATTADRPRTATALASLALLVQAGHSHAASMYDRPSLLLASEALHLIAAGAWLGGLLPLLLLVQVAAPPVAALAARRFTALGTACVLVLAATAGAQSWTLIGSVPGLVGTAYGLMALLKLALFAALVGMALRNRLRLTPATGIGRAFAARNRLVRAIAIEAAAGLLVVLAAALLASMEPAMHVQPEWPFALQPSLVTFREDPDVRPEVVAAGLALAGSLLLLGAAVLTRRMRRLAAPLAAAVALVAWPHLRLLLVPATPTSFYRSPTGFAATGIVAGQGLFASRCASCHGAQGRGDGPAAAGLAIPPADLTAPHLWMHDDGELFWWLSHGIEGPDGGLAMPGFAAALTADERWQLIDFVRARNAGLAMRASGDWSPPVRAPGLQADCAGRSVDLNDLRGRFVLLAVGDAPGLAQRAGVVTIAATPGPGSAGCVADDPAIPLAYAVVSGTPVRELAGTQFLIDDRGWLRAVRRPGDPDRWSDPAILAADISRLRSHPVPAAADAGPMDMPM